MSGAAATLWKTRMLAFYLPQFHPIPENDQWWGRGFTEWTNVARAKPLFRGHYQPHIPADLGFYDLRLPEVRKAQAQLAAAHGVEGFCYWHYWFSGKRLLERPFEEVLRSGQPDFPFALAWANESWSRRWLGEERDILQKQAYSADDDRAHARWLAHAFSDRRYIRLEGRPLFLVYRPADLPDAVATTTIVREVCRAEGAGDPFLVGINAHCKHVDCRTIGFDDTLDFEPQLSVLPGLLNDGPSLIKLAQNLRLGLPSARLKICDDLDARRAMRAHRPSWPTFPSLFVGWDNTPRRGRNGMIITGSTPERFEAALNVVVDDVCNRPANQRLVFLNAWNEWAEGNHLEPDLDSAADTSKR